jgi:hypothetical protein
VSTDVEVNVKKLITVFLMFVMTTGFTFAVAPEGEAHRSPLLGRWAVDVSRLPIPPEGRPKSVTIAFDEASAGRWTMRVDIVDGGGRETDASATYTLDGKQIIVSGSPEADAGAARMPTPDVFVLALSKGGVGVSTRIYSAAADGKNMVESAVYFGQDGKPIMRTNYFSRVR